MEPASPITGDLINRHLCLTGSEEREQICAAGRSLIYDSICRPNSTKLTAIGLTESNTISRTERAIARELDKIHKYSKQYFMHLLLTSGRRGTNWIVLTLERSWSFDSYKDKIPAVSACFALPRKTCCQGIEGNSSEERVQGARYSHPVGAKIS
jgi:hypothetical protein